MGTPAFSLYNKTVFLLLVITVLALGEVPLLSNLLSWQTAFFHEISHGLAALATGGRLLQIELHFSGSGLCYTAGGIRWLVLLAGYAGSSFWGLLLYLSGWASSIPDQKKRPQTLYDLTSPTSTSRIKSAQPSKNIALLPALGVTVVLIFTGALYARDIQTLLVILSLTVLYLGAVSFRRFTPLRLFLKVAGLYVMLDALKALRALIKHQAASDSAQLAALTGAPELFWIGCWLTMAFTCLVLAWKSEWRTKERPDF